MIRPFGLSNSICINPGKGEQSNDAAGHDIHNKSIEGGFCRMPETAAGGLGTTDADVRRRLLISEGFYTGSSGQHRTFYDKTRKLQYSKMNLEDRKG